jgi:alpha-galactosidase
MGTRRLLGIVAVLGSSVTLAEAISPTADELSESRKWVAARFEEGKSVEPFFSFTCGGTPSAELLKTWKLERSSRKLDDKRTERALAYNDPKTGLVVRCLAIEYADFPVIEWTVYLKNAGDKDTPLLEGIQGLDVQFQRGADGEFVLHGIKGDMCTADSFEPYDLTLGPKAASKRSPPDNSGKSCDGPDGWPYYNLQMPGGGVIVAVGWPGQWASTFTRDENAGPRVTAGQQLTHLFLKPGEEIRTPLIAMLFWRGTDVVRSQNLWRRWYIAHVIPHFDGKPQQPASQIQTGGTEADIVHADGFLKAGIKPDICWRDAGWYPTDDGPHKGGGSWLNTGTWDPDPKKLPKGFRPFSDWAHAHGMAFLLWFEPERVGDPNSWLARNHPEWLLPEVPSTVGAILNEGHPEAWKWLVDHVDGMIKSQGIDWYREDMNGCGPLPAWRKNDAEDRQGITENLYVQGHLAFWDELKRRNPSLRIDSCASGGRRNDLETMRRAVPLLRSDFQFPNMKGVVEGNQGHTYGLSFWIPPQGTGVYLCDPYSFRSFLVPFFGSGMGTLTPENIEAQKQYYRECRQIAPSMLFGDYYPLSPYTRSTTHWIAWQFNHPEAGEGVIQAFRHPNSMYDSCQVRLQGLEPDATYALRNLDVEGDTEVRGSALMQDGLSIPIKKQPGAAVIVYRKKP